MRKQTAGILLAPELFDPFTYGITAVVAVAKCKESFTIDDVWPLFENNCFMKGNKEEQMERALAKATSMKVIEPTGEVQKSRFDGRKKVSVWRSFVTNELKTI